MSDTAMIKAALRLEHLVRESGIELKRAGREFQACCPFHEERTPSFNVNVEGQYFKCFGCGKSGDALSWLAWQKFKTLEPTKEQFKAVIAEAKARAGIVDAKPDSAAKPKTIYPTKEKLAEAVAYIAGEKGGRIAAQYEYTHPYTRHIELIVFRIESSGGKSFMQAHSCDGGFCLGGLARNPIYNRTRVAAHEQVIVLVEGEKCVHALSMTGHVATTSPGGANAAAKADWAPLAGKLVTVWPDADASGDRYARDVIGILNGLTPKPEISVIDPSAHGLNDGADAADVIERAGPMLANQIEAVNQILASARSTGPVAELQTLLDDAKAGRRVNVEFCWPQLSAATQALIPGTVTILCGSPGTTKSLAVVQNLLAWQRAGVKAAALMLEDGVPVHLRRGLAQISGESNVTNDKWCQQNGETLDKLTDAARHELATLGAMLEAPADGQSVTPDYLLEWLQRKADAGVRVPGVDPVTLMQRGRAPWADDERFIVGAKRIVERGGASLLLVTHPRRAIPGKPRAFDLDELAGGLAYSRFAHAVLYLLAHPAKETTVITPAGRTQETFNRTMLVLKARNGIGTGRKYAMRFDARTLTLSELGEIADGGDES